MTGQGTTERPNTETLLGNNGRVTSEEQENTRRLKRDEQTQNECTHTHTHRQN